MGRFGLIVRVGGVADPEPSTLESTLFTKQSKVLGRAPIAGDGERKDLNSDLALGGSREPAILQMQVA